MRFKIPLTEIVVTIHRRRSFDYQHGSAFGEYLCRTGMTQKQFADLMGVKQSTISRYVRGDREPDRAAISRIAELTNGEVGPADWFETPEAAE